MEINLQLLNYIQLEFKDNINSLLLVEGNSLLQNYFPPFSSCGTILVKNISNEGILSKIISLLRIRFSDNHSLILISLKGESHFFQVHKTLGTCQENEELIYPLHILLLPQSECYSFENFVELIAHLRSPDGCPWDREQTHQSLRPNLLSETYEVLNAIDKNNIEELNEELGDLLLQIVLHAQIANEKEHFNIDDVIQFVYTKIVYRHPHIFSDINITDAGGVIKNWEILKAKERESKYNNKQLSMLSSVPLNLPALALAHEYQQRAARVGFDWSEIQPVFEKIKEEIEEVYQAHRKKNQDALEYEVGDLLFALVNFSRWINIDAESALRNACHRFSHRFNYIESKVRSLGKKMQDFSLEELDIFWDEAKSNEHL